MPRCRGVGGTHVRVHRAEGATRIWVIGLSDARGQDRLAGSTFGSALVDEGSRIDKDAFSMLWTRLSTPRAKCWLTTNPDNRRHWLKTTVIDRLEHFRGVRVRCRLDDNPSLSDEYKRDVASGLIGHWHQRLVEGEWADASGCCYPVWHHADPPFAVDRYSIALDWASSGTFAALLLAHHAGGRHVLAERVHDATSHGVLTDQEQFLATKRWADAALGLCPPAWVGDPSSSAGFQKCIRDGGFHWIDAVNDVLPGIKLTAHDLASKTLTIGDCPHLEGELGGYVWDERKAALGEDAPVKARDHCVDALRYGNCTPVATFQMLDAVGF